MIWNKSKQPADPQQDAAAAPKKGGAAAFAQKNWKWLVPVAIVVLAGGWWLLKPKSAKPANVDTSYTEAAPETRDVSNTLSGTGTLKPANTYSVKSLVPGKVLIVEIKQERLRKDATDGEDGRKAMAVREWARLNPDRIAYEMLFTDTDTVANNDFARVRTFLGSKS